MRMNTDNPDNAITERIIGCAFRVANALGHGFLERVYENALTHELRKHGISCEQQVPISVTYDGIVVGDYCADIVVEGSVLIELKAITELADVHMAQCLNYLKATGMKTCLLLNFGRARVEVKRISL
jgi:GxxExxY protein